MAPKDKTFYQNPKIDFLFAMIGGEPIPTKQDKFKPIDVVEILEDGKEEILKNFYIKKPDQNAVTEFHKLIQDQAKKIFSNGKKIKKPNKVEVVLAICATPKRFNEVDVDNLAKAILDGLNDIAFEDDSQVTSLICFKDIHPMKINALMVGVTKLTEKNRGFKGGITLYSEKKWK
jgi:Holliday junction resolvase RusA-like endonuclease